MRKAMKACEILRPSKTAPNFENLSFTHIFDGTVLKETDSNP
jgi:hypothetical protein